MLTFRGTRGERAGGRGQPLLELVDSGAGHGGNGDHRNPGKPGRRQQGRDFRAHGFDALGGDAVGLGDHGDAAGDAEELEYVQVLDRLRHHAVVGRDHQQGEVDAAHAGQHVADEALVSRHVHEADHRAAFERPVGEAEIDGDAARLLLRQAVGVDAGQRLHQSRLAVVDVACGGDYHVEEVARFSLLVSGLPRSGKGPNHEQRVTLSVSQDPAASAAPQTHARTCRRGSADP
ncbi:hypothetical protein D3C83_01670 [compost metagenome]